MLLLKGLKQRLLEAKGNWANELPHVLWGYQTTPQLMTRETSFHLTYGIQIVIPIEVEETIWRTTHPFPDEENNHTIREETYHLEEKRTSNSFISVVVKETTTSR